MNDHDVLGFVASGLVLTTFWMRHMLSLRLVAIASNVAFIGYGHVAHIVPVLLLHAFLLPINLWHVLPCCVALTPRGSFATRASHARHGRQGMSRGVRPARTTVCAPAACCRAPAASQPSTYAVRSPAKRT